MLFWRWRRSREYLSKPHKTLRTGEVPGKKMSVAEEAELKVEARGGLLQEKTGNAKELFAVSVRRDEKADSGIKKLRSDFVRGRKFSSSAAIATKFGFEQLLTGESPGKPTPRCDASRRRITIQEIRSIENWRQSCETIRSRRRLFNSDTKERNGGRCCCQRKDWLVWKYRWKRNLSEIE